MTHAKLEFELVLLLLLFFYHQVVKVLAIMFASVITILDIFQQFTYNLRSLCGQNALDSNFRTVQMFDHGSSP